MIQRVANLINLLWSQKSPERGSSDVPMRGRVYYLPRNSKECIVTYWGSDVYISAVCPAHQKEISTTYVTNSGRICAGKVTVSAPELCITHRLKEKSFSLFARIKGSYTPYMLANVYDYGTICFGDIFDHYPTDLRQAWNYYWESPFNDENSLFYDYHQTHCAGVITHNFAGHRDEAACICACCLEICNCACYCIMSNLFETYLRTYQQEMQSACTTIENSSSVKFEVISPKLLILPASYGSSLGLSETKYPDIFVSVLSETDSHFVGQVGQQVVQLPKAWINGTSESKHDSGRANKHSDSSRIIQRISSRRSAQPDSVDGGITANIDPGRAHINNIDPNTGTAPNQS